MHYSGAEETPVSWLSSTEDWTIRRRRVMILVGLTVELIVKMNQQFWGMLVLEQSCWLYLFKSVRSLIDTDHVRFETQKRENRRRRYMSKIQAGKNVSEHSALLYGPI